MISNYRTALVTGASSGIGEAIVRSLTEHGLIVHAVARRTARLQKLANETGCIPHVLDLRDTDALYHTLSPLEIDVLVNNAGIGRGFDTLFKASREDIDRTLETNVIATVHVIKAIAPGMIERGCGHMIHIGSISGLYPLTSSIYGASKGAIHLLSQNLRKELVGTAVRNTEICPGRVHTEFFETAIDDPDKQKAMLESFELLQPTDIAESVIFALKMPRRVNINTIEIMPTEQAVGGFITKPIP
ncbi:MAG: SDR family oxidoreductase [Candidatus Parabeggiatoa sp.]|nr:SDR family oxidoreductase [Candidatus Parabeggiatoa sp.]